MEKVQGTANAAGETLSYRSDSQQPRRTVDRHQTARLGEEDESGGIHGGMFYAPTSHQTTSFAQGGGGNSVLGSRIGGAMATRSTLYQEKPLHHQDSQVAVPAKTYHLQLEVGGEKYGQRGVNSSNFSLGVKDPGNQGSALTNKQGTAQGQQQQPNMLHQEGGLRGTSGEQSQLQQLKVTSLPLQISVSQRPGQGATHDHEATQGGGCHVAGHLDLGSNVTSPLGQFGQPALSVRGSLNSDLNRHSVTGRQPLYSQRNGVDVTKLIKERKEAMIKQRLEQARSKKNAQVNSGIDGLRQETANELSLNLNIKGKGSKLEHTALESDQLIANLESVLKTIQAPPQTQTQAKAQPMTQLETTVFDGFGSPRIKLEPLDIDFQQMPSQMHAARDLQAQNQRKVISLSMGQPRVSSTQDGSNLTSVVPTTRATAASLHEQAIGIYESLEASERQKLLKIFSQFPVNLETHQLLMHFVSLKLQQYKKHQEEKKLVSMQADLQKSADSLDGMHSGSLVNMDDLSAHGGTNNRTSYIGNLPMQEPPYTLSYQRERRERQTRLRNGRGIAYNSLASAGVKKLSSPFGQNQNSQPSLPEVNNHHTINVVDETTGSQGKKKRLRTQQNGNARVEARKQLRSLAQQDVIVSSKEVTSTRNRAKLDLNNPLVSPRLQHAAEVSLRRADETTRSLDNSIDQSSSIHSKNNRSVFQGPRDSFSKFKLNNSLLFGHHKRNANGASKDSQSDHLGAPAEPDKQDAIRISMPNQTTLHQDSLFNHNGTTLTGGELPKQPSTARGHAILKSVTGSKKYQTMALTEGTTSVDLHDMEDSILEVDWLQQPLTERPHGGAGGAGGEVYSKVGQYGVGSAVKVQESLVLAKAERNSSIESMLSQSKVLSNSITASNIKGRLQHMKDCYDELLADQVTFEAQVEDTSLHANAFLKIAQKRDQLLESVFYKSFKTGPGATLNNLPSVHQDVLYALIDGYKQTLLAFGKFSVRQAQQYDYKIERLHKVNEDTKISVKKQKAYDKFLMEKMKNIKEDMKRIEEKISSFDSTTLVGISREKIQDTFSEVTTALEAIQSDLTQERVAIIAPGMEDANSSEEAKQQAERLQRQRVQTFDVMPFEQIKHQIDSNYSEIQSKTTQAIIKRLGLGNSCLETGHKGTQTEVDYVEKAVYKELDQHFFEAERLIEQLEIDISQQNQSLADRKDEIDRSAMLVKKLKAERVKSTEKIAELQVQINLLQEQVFDLKEEEKRHIRKQEQDAKEAHRLEIELTNSKGKLKRAETKVGEVDKELQGTITKVVELKTTKTKLEEKVQEQTTRIQTTTAELQEVEGTLKEVQHQNDVLEDQVCELQRKLTLKKGGELSLQNSKEREPSLSGKTDASKVKEAQQKEGSAKKPPIKRQSTAADDLARAESPQQPAGLAQDNDSRNKAPVDKAKTLVQPPPHSDAKIEIKNKASDSASNKKSGAQISQKKGLDVNDGNDDSNVLTPEALYTQEALKRLSGQTLGIFPESQGDTSQVGLQTNSVQQVTVSGLNVKKGASQQAAESAQGTIEGTTSSASKRQVAQAPPATIHADGDLKSPLSYTDSSSTDSQEQLDNVAQSLYETKMLNMKRQNTMQPFKAHLVDQTAQTDHTGPLTSQADGLQDAIDSKNSAISKQPIYQFSYNRDENGDLKQVIGSRGNDMAQLEEKYRDVKLDKKLLSKDGKIRRGTAFKPLGAEASSKLGQAAMMLGNSANLGSLGKGDTSTRKKVQKRASDINQTLTSPFENLILGKSFAAKQNNVFSEMDPLQEVQIGPSMMSSQQIQPRGRQGSVRDSNEFKSPYNRCGTRQPVGLIDVKTPKTLRRATMTRLPNESSSKQTGNSLDIAKLSSQSRK